MQQLSVMKLNASDNEFYALFQLIKEIKGIKYNYKSHDIKDDFCKTAIVSTIERSRSIC